MSSSPSQREIVFKGAFLAQDPKAFDKEREDGRTLDPKELEALERESSSKWNQPFILYALVACCSLGAAVQGWDEVRIHISRCKTLSMN